MLTHCVVFKPEFRIKKLMTIFLLSLMALMSCKVLSSQWSKTEIFYQHGRLVTPDFAGGGKHSTTVITLQHASGWQYGDNFFFVDFLNDGNDDNFDDRDFYGEMYLNFSLGKILAQPVGFGSIKDVGFVAGINVDADANVIKYLPGVRLSWDVPGFAFLNSDFTAYIDDNTGVRANTNNAPTEQNSYMIDVSFGYPFTIGELDFSVSGHMEYIGRRKNEFGDTVNGWFLAQPMLRLDLGKAIANTPNTFFVGLKWQFWLNKLGEKNTDDNALMALLVWQL